MPIHEAMRVINDEQKPTGYMGTDELKTGTNTKFYEALGYDFEEFHISYHKTKAGAWKAARRWLYEKCVDTLNNRILYGHKEFVSEYPQYQICFIREFTVLD